MSVSSKPLFVVTQNRPPSVGRTPRPGFCDRQARYRRRASVPPARVVPRPGREADGRAVVGLAPGSLSAESNAGPNLSERRDRRVTPHPWVCVSCPLRSVSVADPLTAAPGQHDLPGGSSGSNTVATPTPWPAVPPALVSRSHSGVLFRQQPRIIRDAAIAGVLAGPHRARTEAVPSHGTTVAFPAGFRMSSGPIRCAGSIRECASKEQSNMSDSVTRR